MSVAQPYFEGALRCVDITPIITYINTVNETTIIQFSEDGINITLVSPEQTVLIMVSIPISAIQSPNISGRCCVGINLKALQNICKCVHHDGSLRIRYGINGAPMTDLYLDLVDPMLKTTTEIVMSTLDISQEDLEQPECEYVMRASIPIKTFVSELNKLNQICMSDGGIDSVLLTAKPQTDESNAVLRLCGKTLMTKYVETTFTSPRRNEQGEYSEDEHSTTDFLLETKQSLTVELSFRYLANLGRLTSMEGQFCIKKIDQYPMVQILFETSNLISISCTIAERIRDEDID